MCDHRRVGGASLTEGGAATLSAAPPAETGGRIGVGAAIDRFVVLEQVGAGGMGVVYAAYDPQLHRRVGLKLLRGGQREEATRLVREAQALAQLSHPNVVAVYEVGTWGEQVFVAMELVEGTTLRDWLRERPRGWREIVDVFVMAGRGLAAAHAAGLVHRDVKPGNMLLGRDGRVRMLDFGLAYTPPSTATDRVEETGGSTTHVTPTSSDTLSGPLTETGKIMGTPAYMSPQQHLGRPTDARSDQYSFCVALFEGLYGRRPFVGESAEELKRAKWLGEITVPVARTGVPKWLLRVLERGLSLDPERRWPDMDSLLAQLCRDPRQARRRGALAVAAGAMGVATWWLLQSGGPACTGGAERLGGIWDDARRGEVRAALLSTGLSYAPSTWERVEARLDGYATSWQARHEEACLATARGEQSAAMLDRRMACLDRRREELGALVGELGRGDAGTVQQAVSAVGGLVDPARCKADDLADARAFVPADPSEARRVEQARRRVLEGEAMLAAGRYDAGLALAQNVLEDARAVEDPLLVAEAALLSGLLAEKSGHYEDAGAALREAYFAGLAQGDDRLATRAAAALVLVVGSHLSRFDDGLAWADHARAELARIGGDRELEARLHQALGFAYSTHGDVDAALAHYEGALTLLEALRGPEHPDVARARLNLGSALADAGRREAAIEHYQAALRTWEQVYGPDHPDAGAAFLNLGVALEESGEPEEARRWYERALALYERSLGGDHPHVGSVLNNLGSLLQDQGRHDQALAHHRRARAIFEAGYAPDHPMVVMSRLNIAGCHEAGGRLSEALAEYEQAAELARRTVTESHPYRRGAAEGIARVRVALGDVAPQLP
jgi:tetratricopeptide (TPR) repeat protein